MDLKGGRLLDVVADRIRKLPTAAEQLTNHRLGLLLHCGAAWQMHRTSRL